MIVLKGWVINKYKIKIGGGEKNETSPLIVKENYIMYETSISFASKM